MKMLLNFTIENGKRTRTSNEVLVVTKRGSKYITERGDVFIARFARVSEKKKHGVDLVAVA